MDKRELCLESEKAGSLFLCDTSGKRLPCLHAQPFAGQRIANSFAVSCPGIVEIG